MNTDAPPEPDFEALLSGLEAEVALHYGNAAELKQRARLRASVAALNLGCATASASMVADNRQPYLVLNFIFALGGIFPPRSNPMIAQVQEEAEKLQRELAKDEPNPIVVARSAQRLQEIKHWLGGKGETFATSFTQSLGKSLGTSTGVAAVAGAAGMLGPLSQVIHAAAHWLQAVAG
ncbi:MAG: hypothetical protein QOH47_993 [Sphingomonadales bacterium]|jgi:hypothetical protein|nr:hypothetical protein [Sphingomonadales bacterium]